jgi:hypothetical protein
VTRPKAPCDPPSSQAKSLESLVLPGFEPPAEAPQQATVGSYYVRVELIGMSGTTRRGTVTIDGELLGDLAGHLGGGREARAFIKETVRRLCRAHPQDLSLGHARWKTTTGSTLDELVHRAVVELVG